MTGADGFLGRHVVAALLRAGHRVRAGIGPRAGESEVESTHGAEHVRVDLLGTAPLEPSFEGIDALVHLVARLDGDDRERMSVAVDGTERLLAAMSRTSTRTLVLASSLSVYDWPRVGETLTEASPLWAANARVDSYARAKLDQEGVAQRFAERRGFALTILRPSSLWGASRMQGGEAGRRIGPWFVVVGPRRKLRLTYVENCADAFVLAVERTGTAIRAFNVVDPPELSAWEYARACCIEGRSSSLRVPLPWAAARFCVGAIEAILQRTPKGRSLRTGILSRQRFETEFKPATCSSAAIREALGWEPRFGFQEALARVRAAPGTAASHAGGLDPAT